MKRLVVPAVLAITSIGAPFLACKGDVTDPIDAPPGDPARTFDAAIDSADAIALDAPPDTPDIPDAPPDAAPPIDAPPDTPA